MKNDVVWEMKVQTPIACHRLANGNTFIATRKELIEVDRNGKEAYKVAVQGAAILTAQRLPGGEIAYLSNKGQIVRVDTTGKVLKTIEVGKVGADAQFEVLPDGGVLVPQFRLNKVVEYDAQGKVRWEANVERPFSAARLPGGRVLVTTWQLGKVLEIDRQGKVVWEKEAGPAIRGYRR